MSSSAVIIGASGGIGAALAEALEDEGIHTVVHRFGRSMAGTARLELTNEASIAAAAASIAAGPPPTRVIVATGMLHEDEWKPERGLAELDAAWLARQFAVNTIGPALIIKHFAPLLAPAGAVMALLSARIGSISDNRLGGWYGYRASKAALNQLIRTAATELQRTQPRAILVGLHPGTVDTALSKPFQRNLPPGQLFAPDRAAVQLLDVIDGLGVQDTGRLFDWQGAEIAP